MNRLFTLKFILIFFSMLMISCGDNKMEVTINEDGYTPSDLIIEAGTEVIWTNNDDKTHTVSSGAPELWIFDSGEIKPGEDFTFKFIDETIGSYIYYCKIHGNQEMEGTIVVQVKDQSE